MTVTMPFPVDPAGIDAAGRGAVLFVPAIAKVDAPTVVEINAALVNMSCLLYGWEPKGEQNKTERWRYCYKATVETLGSAKFSVEPITYDYDPQATATTGDYAHYAKLAPGTKGYIIDRRGVDYDTPFTAGQVVDIYPVQLGIRNRVPITDAEGEKLRVTQEIAISGEPRFDVKIA